MPTPPRRYRRRSERLVPPPCIWQQLHTDTMVVIWLHLCLAFKGLRNPTSTLKLVFVTATVPVAITRMKAKAGPRRRNASRYNNKRRLAIVTRGQTPARWGGSADGLQIKREGPKGIMQNTPLTVLISCVK